MPAVLFQVSMGGKGKGWKMRRLGGRLGKGGRENRKGKQMKWSRTGRKKILPAIRHIKTIKIDKHRILIITTRSYSSKYMRPLKRRMRIAKLIPIRTSAVAIEVLHRTSGYRPIVWLLAIVARYTVTSITIYCVPSSRVGTGGEDRGTGIDVSVVVCLRGVCWLVGRPCPDRGAREGHVGYWVGVCGGVGEGVVQEWRVSAQGDIRNCRDWYSS